MLRSSYNLKKRKGKELPVEKLQEILSDIYDRDRVVEIMENFNFEINPQMLNSEDSLRRQQQGLVMSIGRELNYEED